MTNAEGKHYTLGELEQMKVTAAAGRNPVKVRDDAPYAYKGGSDPWAEPLAGGVQIHVEALAAALAELSKMTHELFDRVEPCLADPGDRQDDGGEKPKRVADSASPLWKGLVSLEQTVRDLHDDVVYVLRRVEL